MKYISLNKANHKTSAGFTIIELLIATVIFSVILLLCAAGLLQVARTYYKGITAAKTQQTARAVIDQIGRSIQFGGAAPVPAPLTTPSTQNRGDLFAFCLGNQHYSVLIDKQVRDESDSLDVTADQSRHALVVDTVQGCNTGTGPQDLDNPDPSVSLSLTSRELIPANMRVANLQILQVGSDLYQVSVSIVSGDNELLAQDTTQPASYHKQCGPFRAGTQFCAVSTLTTTVQRRLK